ncbi:hypothetical protein C6Q18_16215 [Pseudomonas chlororaphis subsp. piscium]|nr:hypothetical protein C6Q18_16215 [Pseudomonas chlororaphis subsp. piscium]
MGVCTKSRRARSGKAKTGEEAECRGLHEHSEPVFNAAWPSAATFRTDPNATLGNPDRYESALRRPALALGRPDGFRPTGSPRPRPAATAPCPG